jgi:hypothetical protein
MLGVDMSAKLGDDRAFSILPYTDIKMTKAGVAEAGIGLMGPGMGQVARMAGGLEQMGQGDYYKGLEQLLPSGMRDAMKGARIANEGVTMKNGDVAVKPEDISAMAMILQTLGLPATELKRYTWVQGQQYEIRQFYNDHEKQLRKDYLDAEPEDRAAIKEKWQHLQDGKDKLRQYFNNAPDELKKRDVSTLTKSPEMQHKREQKLQKSVPAAID